MDSSQWTQELGVAKPMGGESRASMERKVRPQKEQALNCPRCHSTNTKFCYYNNYSLTQPRYFCKTCRRYWTEGGTLRNVPVGGGSRKNKRYAVTPPPAHKHVPDLNPKGGHDLNLGFQDYRGAPAPQYMEFPKVESRDVVMHASSSASASALDFLRSGFNSFVGPTMGQTEANVFASSGFPFQECKAANSLSFDDVNGNMNGSLMFALGGGSKRNNTSHELGEEEKGQQNSNGFWNGMLGGGGSAWS